MVMTKEVKEARREARKEARKKQKQIEEIRAEKGQRLVKSLTITIEWKRSRMWGNNPHASVEVRYNDEPGRGEYEFREGFTCSGCGYDKQSTVVAQIFNAFLKSRLWKVTKKRINSDEKPYGIRTYTNDTGRERRYFEAGIGMSCYPRISEFIGGKLETIASTNTVDVYRFTVGK